MLALVCAFLLGCGGAAAYTAGEANAPAADCDAGMTNAELTTCLDSCQGGEVECRGFCCGGDVRAEPDVNQPI